MQDKILETDRPTPSDSTHRSHSWMMIGCVAMVAAVVVLVATSTVPTTLLFGAVACMAMMGVMMLMMARGMGGHDHRGNG